MTSNEIRASFLKFFQDQGHRVVPSSSLVPGDDPTLLFTNAGMNQFKDVFLGREKREYTRATTSQKVMRVSGKHNDLDNVGPSPTHHTFFQMLGNFSFGDYFKKDAIRFAWTLLTDVWKMPADRLMPSVFKGEGGIPRDQEAFDIWKELVPEGRILQYGLDDNFWQMGDTGPCGRCSEIYYVHAGDSPSKVEIWNLVFMEFNRGADGKLTPLPAPSIDTGMGFERVTAVLQNKASNYDTDQFMPILTEIAHLADQPYGGTMSHSDVSMRVVADHLRSMTFLIADGVMPSNEFRGYVLRKIMRRAMRHGKHLGFSEPFLSRLVSTLDRQMGDVYPEIRTHRELVEKTILAEENRFDAVLTDGLPRLEAELAKASASGSKTLGGDAAFRLYDTFGVPYDFIEDTAITQGLAVDQAGFEAAMESQREKARAKSAFGAHKRSDDFVIDREQELAEVGDRFEGYSTTSLENVPVVGLFDDQRRPVAQLAEGQHGFVSLAQTPFYVEAGGQVSDTGMISSEETSGTATVEGVTRIRTGLPRAHVVRVTSGALRVGDPVTVAVDATVRDATRRNHTATHLLHAALRQVLGAHVKQAGSLVAPDRLRFDFVHFQPVAREELDRIERIVNEQIVRNTPVETHVRSTSEAIAAGAMALFGEKYGDTVRVVSVPGFSMELCGGTHVRATGDIGPFVITSESGVAAGVRRIEALTGMGAVKYLQDLRETFAQAVAALHVNPDQAVEAIERLQADAKRLTRDVSQLKTKIAMGGGAAQDAEDAIEVAGIKLARRRVSDFDKDSLRALADSLKAKIKSGVVVIASTGDGKVQVVVAVTSDLTSRIKAGQVVKAIAPVVGGGGGGRPDFAEAGGKLPEKVDEMLGEAERVVAEILGS
jgi:alanyl-tRNA synthetase